MIIAPRVIAVDNDPAHLQALEAAFDGLGGLCECIEFSRATGRTVPFMSGVRILFMDINLMPGAGGGVFSPRTGSPIATVIRKLIGQENGPYALITWTANTPMHNDLVNWLEDNLEPNLRPCATYCLSKEEHLEDAPALIAKLKTIHNDIPGLAMLLDWERAVTKAADRSVHQIAQLSGLYGRAQGNAVAEAVFAISGAAAGAEEARRRPFYAFTNGMSAVLADQMDAAPSDVTIEDAWKRVLVQAAPAPASDIQRAALNTFFHYETAPALPSEGLGSVFAANFRQIREFFLPRFTTSRSALLSNEFIPIRNNRLIADAERAAFARACRWRLIQLGASCDHSNGKVRVLDSLLAVEVPEALFDDTDLPRRANGRSTFRDTPAQSDWLFQTPPFLRDGQRYVLVVNLRYRVGLPLTTVSDFPRLGRLREGLATEIAAHSANFSTRPGIIEFR